MDLEANALDDDVADKLWDRSLQLCGIPVPQWYQNVCISRGPDRFQSCCIYIRCI